MKVSNRLLNLIIISTLLTSCIPTNISTLGKYYTPIPSSPKTLDIPKYGDGSPMKGYPYVYWNFCKQKQRQLGLESPETSVDSILFRVWQTSQNSKRGQEHALIEIRKDSLGWSGYLILMLVDFKLGKLSETITDYKKINIMPLKSDWQTVVDSLYKLKINELPTDESIPEYYTGITNAYEDKPTISFEFATKDSYRFYQYNDIYRASDKFWQPAYVIKILTFLNIEFQLSEKADEYFK